jgi:hypothetical protein
VWLTLALCACAATPQYSERDFQDSGDRLLIGLPLNSQPAGGRDDPRNFPQGFLDGKGEPRWYMLGSTER